MKVVSSNNIDKRKYFRVDDIICLTYKILSWADARDIKKMESDFPAHRFECKAKLDRLSRELQPLHKLIKENSPNVAQYLETIDNKISLLCEYLLDAESVDDETELQEVNIGGGGFMFVSDKPINDDAMLEVKIKLLPENYKIFSYAKVVSCDRADNGAGIEQYKVAVEFKYMDEDVRNLITRHVLLREQELINRA